MTSLRRGVALNAVGWALPAALALVSVPALTRLLEPSRFGLVALTWAAVAAFGVLDLGAGRAVSFLVADREARGAASDAGRVVATAGRLVWWTFGPLAALGLLTAPWLVRAMLDVPPALHAEAVGVVRLLALALPVVVHGIVLRAAFEGAQRFGMVNAFRVPLGVATWGGPLLVALVTTDARAIAGVVVGARALYWLAQWAALGWPVRGADYGTLLRAGGWMGVSGIVSPILTMADRAFVPAVAPIAVVGWYVASGEAATKLWLLPSALQPVLFPALTGARARGGAGVGALATRATALTGIALLAPALALAVGADPLMRWWLGESWAPGASALFALFVAAVYVNSIAQVGYSALQASGESRAAALLHLWELPLFLAALWIGARHWGAIGAGVAWSARLLLDAVAMWWLAWRRIPALREVRPALLGWGAVGGAALLALSVGVGVSVLASPG